MSSSVASSQEGSRLLGDRRGEGSNLPRTKTIPGCLGALLLACGAVIIIAVAVRLSFSHHRDSGVVSEATPYSSPWCSNSAHPAEPGMYGEMGSIDVAGGFVSDLPTDDVVTVQLFRQGLTHAQGFNGFEALRNFRSATARSPTCALCHWGVAKSLSPNINYFIEDQATLNDALEKAHGLARAQLDLSPKTRQLIEAYYELRADRDHEDGPEADNRANWARALCVDDGTDDDDLSAECAGAIMSNTPWNYYAGIDAGGNYPMKDEVVPAKEILLGIVKRRARNIDPPHVLASHLLIHLLEPTNAPPAYKWEALPAAMVLFNMSTTATVDDIGEEGLSPAAPSQGHLTHMPAHLFLRTGLYALGVETSKVAVRNNLRYVESCLHPAYHAHNLKMLVSNARMAGMYGIASRYAADVHSAGLDVTPMGYEECQDCGGRGSPHLVLTHARFGRWQAVLDEPIPMDWGHPALAAYNEASFRLARALAYYGLASESYDGGANARERLVELADAEAEMSRSAAPGAVSEENLLDASGHFGPELRAVRAWRIENDAAAAVDALHDLVAADDSIMYVEPPVWYYPPRQCLGYALLASPSAGGADIGEALDLFERDLVAYPENAWSLHGAADALEGLGRRQEAEEYRSRAVRAWGGADISFESACPQLSY